RRRGANRQTRHCQSAPGAPFPRAPAKPIATARIASAFPAPAWDSIRTNRSDGPGRSNCFALTDSLFSVNRYTVEQRLRDVSVLEWLGAKAPAWDPLVAASAPGRRWHASRCPLRPYSRKNASCSEHVAITRGRSEAGRERRHRRFGPAIEAPERPGLDR